VYAPSVSILGYGALAALIVWRVYAKFRRAIGPHRLSKYRAPITFLIYGLIFLALVRVAWSDPRIVAELLACVGAGALLGTFALTKTTFQVRPRGLFYTPHTPIALTLVVLFVARVIYRIVEVTVLHPTNAGGLRDFAASPLTVAALGLVVGYYVWYTVRLAAWRRRVLAAKRAREAAQSDA